MVYHGLSTKNKTKTQKQPRFFCWYNEWLSEFTTQNWPFPRCFKRLGRVQQGGVQLFVSDVGTESALDSAWKKGQEKALTVFDLNMATTHGYIKYDLLQHLICVYNFCIIVFFFFLIIFDPYLQLSATVHHVAWKRHFHRNRPVFFSSVRITGIMVHL